MLYNVKAGIIGLEPQGLEFALLVRQHVKNLNLIAAAGRTQKELLIAKNELSLEYVYSDENALIENHDIDVILNFAPESSRAHLSIRAIDKGKHLITSNPIALNADDAIEVRKAAASRPSQYSSAITPARYIPEFDLLRNYLSSGKIGDVRLIEINNGFIKAISNQYPGNSGSNFLDLTLNEIDLCLSLLNEPCTEVNVENFGTFLSCSAKTDNTSGFTLKLFKDVPLKPEIMNIYGSEGQLTVNSTCPDQCIRTGKDGHKEIVELITETRFAFPEYLQLHHFTNVILGKEKSRSTIDHAVKTIQLAVAFEKSKVLNTPVSPEELRD